MLGLLNELNSEINLEIDINQFSDVNYDNANSFSHILDV